MTIPLPESVQQVLRDVHRLPGAVGCCVVDPATGEVLTEPAAPSAFTTEVVRWAAAVAALLSTPPVHELDDIMITSRGAYHLVRRVAPAGRRPLLVVLALDRAVSNLAVARRELAASGSTDVVAGPVLRPVTPLPSRSGPARGARRWLPPVAPRIPQPALPTVLRQQWADDVDTMRQLLVGLRSLAS